MVYVQTLSSCNSTARNWCMHHAFQSQGDSSCTTHTEKVGKNHSHMYISLREGEVLHR